MKPRPLSPAAASVLRLLQAGAEIRVEYDGDGKFVRLKTAAGRGLKRGYFREWEELKEAGLIGKTGYTGVEEVWAARLEEKS